MFKIIYIFILTFTLTPFISAKEPNLVFLQSVISNELQKYSIGKYNFICHPYGVITVDRLYKKSTFNSTCKKSVEQFYKKNPQAKYFSLNKLKVKQMYHVEFIDKQCLVFAQGEKTLSELLLENGLAFREPLFEDKEYIYTFEKAQRNARYQKRGLWSENIIRDCISEIYK